MKKNFDASEMALKTATAQSMKYYQDMILFNQGNVEACLKSAKLLTAGLKEMATEISESGKNTVEECTSLTKSLVSATSIKIAPKKVTLRLLKRAGAAPCYLAVMVWG